MMESEDEEKIIKKKSKRFAEFIDDEAELSGEDDVSEDENEDGEDADLEELIDRDTGELDSDEEETVRNLYHKQLESEDRRAVHLLREHFEENAIGAGQGRRRKFRWQTKELMENSLKRHYDPDDDDSEDDDDEDDIDFSSLKPRLRRPNAEAIVIGSTKIITEQQLSDSHSAHIPCTSDAASHDNPSTLVRNPVSDAAVTSDINRFLFRDRGLVEALSTRETVITTREEKDRVIQREIKRVLQSKSIFDQLYS